ncbi:MAG: hypothetical protein ACLR0U_16335 [Enterocloster clostridioformis]
MLRETTEEKTQGGRRSRCTLNRKQPSQKRQQVSQWHPIIRHYAPVVADNEEGNAEEAPKVEEAKEPEAEPEEKTRTVTKQRLRQKRQSRVAPWQETESAYLASTAGNPGRNPRAVTSDETTAEAERATRAE